MTRGIRYATIATEGLDNVFYCWARIVSTEKGFEEEFKVCRASDFWLYNDKEKRYTEFTLSKYVKPNGYITVSLRSKEMFRWGSFELRAKLPKYKKGPMFWFGFELDDLFGGGVVHFMWHSDKEVLKAFAGGFNSRVEIDLTKYIPSDIDKSYHLYKIVRREGLALWYIDNRLRAMAVLGAGDTRDSAVIYDGKPYAIGFTRDTPSEMLPILLDIDGGDVETEFIWPALHPWDLRVSEGVPNTPLYIDLFIENSDTKLKDSKIENEVVSAPFPGILNQKEILFVTEGRGEIVVEGYANGEWLEYLSVSVEGKRLYIIPIQGRSFMYRVVFRPRIPSRIIEAQAILQ